MKVLSYREESIWWRYQVKYLRVRLISTKTQPTSYPSCQLDCHCTVFIIKRHKLDICQKQHRNDSMPGVYKGPFAEWTWILRVLFFFPRSQIMHRHEVWGWDVDHFIIYIRPLSCNKPVKYKEDIIPFGRFITWNWHYIYNKQITP